MTCGRSSPERQSADRAALEVWQKALADTYTKSGLVPPPPPGVPAPPSVAALRLAEAILTLPRKIVQAVQGYNFKLGKRPADHPSNLRHGRMLAIPTVAVFVRDALTQHASVSAFDFLGLREKAITTAELRALGFVVPKGRERFRWMVFHDAAERVLYADVHTILSTLGIDCPHPEQDGSPFVPFPLDGPASHNHGKGSPVCCPFHEDANPSAAIYPLSPRGYGAGVCRACTGPDGMPLRFCYRATLDGSFEARIARKHRDDAFQMNDVKRVDSTGRYNRGPAGCVTPPRVPFPTASRLYGTTLGVSLRAYGSGSGWGQGTSTARLTGDVLTAIVRSEATADYGNIRPKVTNYEFEAARRMVQEGTPHNADARDRLIRVQPQYSTYSETYPWGSVPSGWQDAGVQFVPFDFDDFNLGIDGTAQAWADRVVGLVARDPRCSGRVTVVRTSGGGAQVIAELARPIAGRQPGAAWFASNGPRKWYRELGERMLAAGWELGAEGGDIDWSAFAPNRLMRRPGWRVTKDGEVYRSHLLAAVLDVAASAPVTLAA